FKAITKLTGHRDGQAIVGRELPDQLLQSGRQAGGVLPKGEGNEARGTVGVCCLQISAADIQAEYRKSHDRSLAAAPCLRVMFSLRSAAAPMALTAAGEVLPAEKMVRLLAVSL